MTNSATDPHTCLNPPEPPAPSLQDAPFRVWSENQTEDQAVTANTITWYDKASTLTHTARLHGTWFIATSTDSSGNVGEYTYNTALKGPERQSFKIFYTDWSDIPRVASFLSSTDGLPFMSVGLGRGTSTAESYAWTQDQTLQYVDAAGNKKRARVALELVEPPTVAPTWNPSPPLEGSPVTFTANGSSAAGTPFYEWKYQVSNVYVPFLNGWFVCGSPPCCGPSSYGDNPTITFPRSGDFHMLLTATSSLGRATAYPFTLSVGDVPPTNTLAPVCDVAPCPAPFNPTVWTPGQTTQLRGTLSHIGPLDTVKVTIDWGDGTASTTGGCGPASACGVPGSTTFTTGFHVPDMPWVATHTYASPGVYEVFATASEHPGGADTAKITESVRYKTALALSPSTPTSVYGQPVTLTAMVSTVGTIPAGAAPAGTVTFLDGTTTLGTGQIGAGGVAALTTGAFGIGVHSLKATFGGDQTFRPASAPVPDPFGFVVPITLTVSKAATSSAVASSVSPSVFGQPVTFTATVSSVSPGAGSPTGAVDFKDGSATICAAKAVNGAGQATCTTSALAAAGHSVTASYLGDANFNGSTSQAGSQTVNRATTTTAVGSSKPTSTQGDTVTFTATVAVTAPGAGVPGGIVTFKDGATSLGTATVGATGTASFSTSSLASAAHSITADYGGDSSFVASTGQVAQFVNTSLSGFPMLPTGAVNLGGVNLSGGYFFDALLAGANLSNSNFKNATFSRAILVGANMSGSNFKDANFSNANLAGANLTGANLLGATGLTTATLTNAIWSKTTCPDGFVTAKTGGTCAGHLR